MSQYGNQFYGADFLGGSGEQRLTAGATLTGIASATAVAILRVRAIPSTLQGGSAFTSTYAGLPQNVKGIPTVLQGGSQVFSTGSSGNQIVDGSLIVLANPDKATTERGQFSRGGRVVV